MWLKNLGHNSEQDFG